MRLKFSRRRGLSLLLAALLIFPAACSQNNKPDVSQTSQDVSVSEAAQSGLPEPAAAYVEAVNALRERLAGSRYRSSTETRMDISSAAGRYSTFATSNTQVSQGDDFFMLVETTESAPNASSRTITFVDGKYVYMYEQGVTYRMDLDEQTRTQLLEQNTAGALDLEGAAPSSQSIQPLEAGGHAVTLTFLSPAPELVAKLLPSLRTSVGNADASVKSLSVSAAVDGDGLLQTQDFEVEMELTADGQQAQVTARISTRYSDIDGDFTISLPDEIDLADAIAVDDVETE